MASAAPNPKFRVKVYELNDDGEWSDKGTGHVQFQIVQSVEAAYMFVHSEVDSSLLLETKVIMEDDAYQRQGDTIVSWTEPMSRQDLALSFAEAAGCQEIWEKLCAVRGIDPQAYKTPEEEPTPPSRTFSIPTIEPGNLKAVLDFFHELSPFMKEGVAATLVQTSAVQQVITTFKQLEEAHDTEQLHLLFNVVVGMITMNETNLLDQLLNDDHYISIFGVLEYDPALKHKPNYRDFMQHTATFKQVVPFHDPSLVTRIHQNFRVTYLKDVVLPQKMDDATFGTLNSVVFFNSIEIIQHLQSDSRFLTEVFTRLKNIPSLEEQVKAQEDQANLFGLLQELCQLSKNLQLEARSAFFKMLLSHGILHTFESALGHPRPKTRLAAFEIFAAFVVQDSKAVRLFMLQQEPKFGLLGEIVSRILEDSDHGLKGQATEILRQLLDPEAMDQSQEKNQFMNIFYERFLDRLIQIFNQNPSALTPKAHADLNVSRNHVCELLTFFVQTHGYRIKYFVLRNNIVGKVCELMKEDEKYVALSAVRFVRACIGLKDEFYFRYMIKNNSFAPIVQLFKDNQAKYNLLNSAIVELFDFIRKENIKSLISYTVQRFGEELKKVTYVDTFTSLCTLYEQNKEFMPNIDDMSRPDDGLGGDSEESYFASQQASESQSQQQQQQQPNAPHVPIATATAAAPVSPYVTTRPSSTTPPVTTTTTATTPDKPDNDVVFTDATSGAGAGAGLVPYPDDNSD